jgi:Ca-activated chloride channel family protein
MRLNLASPWLLLLAPLVLGALIWTLRRRRATASALRLPRAASMLRLASPWARMERVLPWLRACALLLLVAALTRPQAGEAVEDVSTFGVDIVIALDVSGSMSAEDFRPLNRLEVARATVDRFIAGRPTDRIGLVVFASVATTRCPVTLDHTLLRQLLAEVDFAPPEQRRTAIGMGLATAVNRLRRSEARSKVIVLVTDGQNTAGQVGPMTAAQAAHAMGVKLYTVGVGSEGEVPIPVDTPLGRRYQMVRADLDEPLLREMAQTAGGRYFRATDAEALREIFATIDELERSETQSRVRMLYGERYAYLLWPALGLLGLERLLRSTRLSRIP